MGRCDFIRCVLSDDQKFLRKLCNKNSHRATQKKEKRILIHENEEILNFSQFSGVEGEKLNKI